MTSVLFGILIYVLAQLLVGLVVSRRIANEEDYLLAGRSLGYGLATFSLFGTWFGAETCLGAAGAIYRSGLSGASADPFGYALCLILMGLVFAVPLWRRKLTTLADLFRVRYSETVERLAVAIMTPTSILWAAAQIRAFGQVLGASGGIEATIGTSIGAAVAILYTVSGGLRADVLTDLVQGIAIIIGLVILLVAILDQPGGLAGAWDLIEPQRLELFTHTDPLAVLEAWSIPIFGSVVAQELAMRVLAARSPQVARRSTLLGGGLYLVVGVIPVLVGLIGIQSFPGLQQPEQILPMMAAKHLSTFTYILFAGALVSAILSTVDSTLLAASSLVSHNWIIRLSPAITERRKVFIARIGVVLFGAIAYLLALHGGSVYTLVKEASGFGSAGIFVVMSFGLFSRIGGRGSATAALLTGIVVWICGNYIAHFAYSYLASLAGALLAYLLFAHRSNPTS